MVLVLLFSVSGLMLGGMLLLKMVELERGALYGKNVRAHLDMCTITVGCTIEYWMKAAARSFSRDVALNIVHGISLMLLRSLRSAEDGLARLIVRVRAKRMAQRGTGLRLRFQNHKLRQNRSGTSFVDSTGDSTPE